MHTMRWAKLVGCPCIDTTDDRHRPAGMTDREAMDHMRRIICYAGGGRGNCAASPSTSNRTATTTKPEFLAEMLSFCDSPRLRLNMDTGNTFIAGQDPVAFVSQFIDRVTHVHVKDVSESLASAGRGDLTGIAVSHCAIGDGVSADNIRRVVASLRNAGFDGVCSIECEGNGGPMIERPLAWVREVLS
jgi:sugar phosphate isomerase/epimerase